MKYLILGESSTFSMYAVDGLEKKVKQFCISGWEPQGGVQVFFNNNTGLFEAYQAMIMKTSDDK